MKMNLSIGIPSWAIPFAWIALPIVAGLAAFRLVCKYYRGEVKKFSKPLDNLPIM